MVYSRLTFLIFLHCCYPILFVCFVLFTNGFLPFRRAVPTVLRMVFIHIMGAGALGEEAGPGGVSVTRWVSSLSFVEGNVTS